MKMSTIISIINDPTLKLMDIFVTTYFGKETNVTRSR